MTSYIDARAKVLEKYGISRDFPNLIDCWVAFVEECEDGYRWDVSEYNNEISVRNELEMLVKDSVLLAFTDHSNFVEKIEEGDNRFRKLLHPTYSIPGKTNWWEKGVLAAAGEAYVEYFNSAHKFDLTMLDN